MSNKRQSAVESLEKAFYTYAESTGINSNKWVIYEEDLNRLIEQAKEKQRQQLDHAFINGKFVYTGSDETSQQYYEDNYE